MYLAVLLDLYSRMVVGWAMRSKRDKDLVEGALIMALKRRRPGPGLLPHSDRGSQFKSGGYRAILAEQGIEVSMSRKGDCLDNAAMESFNGTLKGEWVDRHQFETRREAKTVVFEYMEIYYKRERSHSTLGYQSPGEFEKKEQVRPF